MSENTKLVEEDEDDQNVLPPTTTTTTTTTRTSTTGTVSDDYVDVDVQGRSSSNVLRSFADVESEEDIKTELFLSQDAQFMISRSFLKMADPSMMKNEPQLQIMGAFFGPLAIVFAWLCIPLVGTPSVNLLLFSFIFQPLMALLHCILLWYLLGLYIPTPSPRVKLWVVMISIGVDVIILLNLLWSRQVFEGFFVQRVILVIALFGICVPIFLASYYHCRKIIRLGRGKFVKSDVLGAVALHKATEQLAGETLTIVEKKPEDLSGLLGFFSRFLSLTPCDSVLLPWKPASLKKRCWNMYVGIVFDIGIYSILIVLSLLVLNSQSGVQFITAFVMYFVEIGIHKVSSIISTRLDRELCFEIPQYLFHSFFIDLIFYSYNRNALYLSVSSYTNFAIWQVVHVFDDFYAGMFTFFSYKFWRVPLIGRCSIPNLPEVKEVIAMGYVGKKQAQLFSNFAFILFMFLLKYYWNRDMFPYQAEERMDMLVVYSISMFVIDIATGSITMYFMNKHLLKYNKTIVSLTTNFYTYPNVGAIVALLSILSLQYTYTSIFFTGKL